MHLYPQIQIPNAFPAHLTILGDGVWNDESNNPDKPLVCADFCPHPHAHPTQGHHGEFEPDKAHSTVVGIICPPG